MEREAREILMASDPTFCHIICRCEQISEGEILDAIRRPVGARTVKGVKKRARPGMGRCQGGFCEPRVVEILAKELGVPPTQITYDGTDAYLFAEASAATAVSNEEDMLTADGLWEGDGCI